MKKKIIMKFHLLPIGEHFFDNFFNPAYIKTFISDSSQVAVLHSASHTLASGIGTGLQ